MSVLVRFTRHRDEWALNFTRWFYLTNHHYAGERKWYMRLGRRPGHVFVWAALQRPTPEVIRKPSGIADGPGCPPPESSQG